MLSLTSAALLLALAGQSIPERMQMGLELLARGDVEEARTVFEQILAEEPEHGPARLQLGRLALEGGRWDEAEEHLAIAVRSSPQRVFLAWHLLGRVHLRKGSLTEARASFEEALSRAPDFVPARLGLLEVAEREGRYWEALSGYRTLLETAPADAERWEIVAQVANLARVMGAFGLAECMARRALDARPRDGYLHFLLAVVLKDAGKTEEAMAEAVRARELGFEQAALYVTLGDLYYEKMRISDSIAALARALELDPAAAESIASFALTSLTTEDYAALRAVLERHSETHPESVNTLYGLGAMYLREGELERAEGIFLRLERLVPRQSQVHYNLGLVHQRRGEEAKARQAMERFRELKAEEDREWLRRNQAHARRLAARDASAEGRREEAVRLYEELARDGVAETEDLVALARAHREAGRPSEASRWLAQILTANPYHREALAMLASLEAEAVRGREAREKLALLESPCERTP